MPGPFCFLLRTLPVSRRRALPHSIFWKTNPTASSGSGRTHCDFQANLKQAGFSTGNSETPITPIHVGDAAKAFEFSRELFNAGVLATGIGYPTVPRERPGFAPLSLPAHTSRQLDQATEIMSSVAKKLQIIP